MSTYVEPRGTYPIIETGREVRKTNITGHVVYVCDCCAERAAYPTRSGAERHERYQSSKVTAAEMGIYPGLGEELSDYLPGYKSRYPELDENYVPGYGS